MEIPAHLMSKVEKEKKILQELPSAQCEGSRMGPTLTFYISLSPLHPLNSDLLYKPFTSAPTELLQHQLQHQLLVPLHSQSGRETPGCRDVSLWRNYTWFSPVSEVCWRTVSISNCRPFQRICWLGFCERGWRLDFLGELFPAPLYGRKPSLYVPLPFTLSKCTAYSELRRYYSGLWIFLKI